MSLLIVHAAATWFMVGLIWVVQVVHYPLFAAVGPSDFVAYEHRHTRRMGRLLLIPAVVEIATAAALVFTLPGSVRLPLALGAGALLATIWITTALVQFPLHQQLSTAHDARAIDRLVSWNWIRTILWTGRGLLAAFMLAQ